VSAERPGFRRDGGWRAYFNENSGYTTVGNFYSDSLDGWATWSTRANLVTAHLMSHGTYIRVASLPGDDRVAGADDRLISSVAAAGG
jgi:hypothetical protein